MPEVPDALSRLGVSRETMGRLQEFADLVARWTPKINLISSASVPNLMSRHIVDSAQLFGIPDRPIDHWADLGSGGGFPGIVLAIMAKEHGDIGKITLVESDARKCAFLREAVRLLGLSVVVVNERIERVPPLNADVLSARALAPLTQLFGHAAYHLRPTGTAIFPKGARHQEEQDEAAKHWSFKTEARPSITDADARILVIRSLKPLQAERQNP